MNRYKPVGWRYESQRHALAARGVRTSFAKKKSNIDEDLYRALLSEEKTQYMLTKDKTAKTPKVFSSDPTLKLKLREIKKEQASIEKEVKPKKEKEHKEIKVEAHVKKSEWPSYEMERITKTDVEKMLDKKGIKISKLEEDEAGDYDIVVISDE